MNHFKTLALGTALLFTATIETQAACVSCPTGKVNFTCNAGKCTALVPSSDSGTWVAQATATSSFSATLPTGTPTFPSKGVISCSYAKTTTQPAITLTWMTLENKQFTCQQDTTLCSEPTMFSCTD